MDGIHTSNAKAGHESVVEEKIRDMEVRLWRVENALYGDQQLMGLIESSRNNGKSLEGLSAVVKRIDMNVEQFRIKNAQFDGVRMAVKAMLVVLGMIIGWVLGFVLHYSK